MCKLLFISNFKSLNISESKLNRIMQVMAIGNDDGLGIFSETGHIKTDNPKMLYAKKFGFLNRSKGQVVSEGDFLEGTNLAIHSRISTNFLGVEYSHPFKTEKAYFAHNGVVDILENNFPLKTKNDSEFLAHYYESGLENLKNINGYYAFIRYDFEKNLWNIGRDDSAQLTFCKIAEHDSFIITTKVSDVAEILKILGLEAELTHSMPEYTQINILGHEVASYESLPKMITSRAKDSLYNKSIGNELNSKFIDSFDYLDSWSSYDSENFTSEVSNEDKEFYFEIGYEDGLKGKYDQDMLLDDEISDELIKCYDDGYDFAQSEMKRA